MTVSEDFTSQTRPYRGELLAHCYRMLGSAQEAEDLVQETYLRAWRAYAGFAGRSSVRTWLYRIATNVCLTALERRARRPVPSGLDTDAAGALAPDVPWLRPMPDRLLAGPGEDPAAVAASRAGIRLAFVAALQYLSARQRAVLILRDVLDWPAADVAQLLDTTTTAVHSAVRRARAQLARALPAPDELAEPDEAAQRAALDRFAAAFEAADLDALADLLRADAVLEMPPMRTWFAGRPTVVAFLAGMGLFDEPGRCRVVPVAANGRPAFAVYRRDQAGVYRADAVTVPVLTATGVARIVAFPDPELFAGFGLPAAFAPQEPPVLAEATWPR
jgi:RNA polymerase sigma-70 factor (ECF subfamily)